MTDVRQQLTEAEPLKISPERMAEMVAQHEALAAELLHTPEARAAYHRAAVERGRRMALVEAYWKLVDHAEGLRNTASRKRAEERVAEGRALQAEGLGALSDVRAERRLAGMRGYVRGLVAAAGDLAELLGVEEHEIERPVGTPEGTNG